MARASVTERFWRFVDKTRGPDACWTWIGSCVTGYGWFWSQNKMELAHRHSWQMHNGPIPEGLFVCHHCDNRPCINPKHLFLGTDAENKADMHAKGRHYTPTRIPDSTIREVRAATGGPTEISRRFGISEPYVRELRAGKKRAALRGK